MNGIDSLLTEAWQIAIRAGDAIMAYHSHAGSNVDIKGDGSPVTAADHAAEGVIMPALKAIAPHVPVISEEMMDRIGRPANLNLDRPFWLVDPLDGTKDFVRRGRDFTVNIALIAERRPVMGVIHAPARSMTYGGTVGGFALMGVVGERPEPMAVRAARPDGLTAIASANHDDPADVDRLLEGYAIAARVAISSSLKFALVASGQADIYPRSGPTMEWDTAAGQALLIAAGGTVCTPDGTALAYGKDDFRNSAFIARGG